MPTKHAGADKEQRALNLFIALSRSADWLQKGALQYAPLPDALTLTQFGILEALYHLGPMCQAEVGEKLLKTKGNVSVVIERLVSRGLVERSAKEQDRRYVVIKLTTAGRHLIQSYFPKIAAGFARAASSLTLDEQKELTRLSVKLGKAVQAHMSKGENS
ncbi:MAG: MarR family transcriptional regulator [Spirochaeta sp.]|nr:MarR family transcriptional regulator [Spirochaeta sp.]